MVEVPGTPTLSVGDHLLAVFHSNGDDLVRIDRWQTRWFMRAPAADDVIVTSTDTGGAE